MRQVFGSTARTAPWREVRPWGNLEISMGFELTAAGGKTNEGHDVGPLLGGLLLQVLKW